MFIFSQRPQERPEKKHFFPSVHYDDTPIRYFHACLLRSRDEPKKKATSKASLLKTALLKGPSQPPPFLMTSKLLILHGEAKSDFFTIGCVPERRFNYLSCSHSNFLRFDMLRRKYNSQTLACKQKQGCG